MKISRQRTGMSITIGMIVPLASASSRSTGVWAQQGVLAVKIARSSISTTMEGSMAKNTGKGHRQGEVSQRSQTRNPRTAAWIKRDSKTGQFLEGKADGKPFKGVRKER